MNFFSNRAFAAFTVALAASMWALFTDIGRPYLPSVPIVVYTIYLYANRQSVGQLGGDALKDSPYFLGFLLTMFALFKIFNDVASSAAVFGANPALLTQEVGGAVLTTIVGLFCRQALLALVQDEAPEEDDRLAALANAVTSHAVAFEVARQQFFREMADERARQAEEFKATQARFLAQLGSLTAVRPDGAPSAAPASVRADAAAAGTPAGGLPAMGTPMATAGGAAVDAVLEAGRIQSATDAVRTAPYAGPVAGSSTPPSSPSVIQGFGTATGTPSPSASGSLPPHPPYLGQGRASNTPRSEG